MEEENKELENNNIENNVEKKEEKKLLSILAMVFGLVGFIVLPIPCGITAIVLSLIGKNKGGRGFATAGFILGIADVVCGIIIIAYSVIKIMGAI